jgi:DUF971 family protein
VSHTPSPSNHTTSKPYQAPETLLPTQLQPLSPIELFVAWQNGEKYSVPYTELRFQCPCAGCVDEHTGIRTIRREQVRADIRPTGMQLVGRYAVQVSWIDGHSTGMYHFERLYEICKQFGRAFTQ